MKRVIGAMVMGMALLAVGCSDGKIKSVDDDPVMSAEGGGGTGGTGSAGGAEGTVANTGVNAQALETYEVRMLGENADGYTKLLLIPNGLRAFADGTELMVKPTFKVVDLANMGHAEQIATFQVPKGAKDIRFKLDMGAAGGFDTGASSGFVDTGNTELEFAVSAEELARMKKTVVIFDASRSFIERDAETRVLVPNFRID